MEKTRKVKDHSWTRDVFKTSSINFVFMTCALAVRMLNSWWAQVFQMQGWAQSLHRFFLLNDFWEIIWSLKSNESSIIISPTKTTTFQHLLQSFFFGKKLIQ